MPPSKSSPLSQSYNLPEASVKRRLSDICSYEEVDAPFADKSSKRQKTQQPSTSFCDSQSSPSMHSVKMARFDPDNSTMNSSRSAGFHPQSGTRKLVIKNLRIAPGSSQREHYNKLWTNVCDALMDIYGGRQPLQPLELLYRDVEDICRIGQAEKLYKHLETTCSTYLQKDLLSSVLAQLPPSVSKVEALRAVYNAWRTWNARSMQIRSVFSYLDRSYLLNSMFHPQLNTMAIENFRKLVCEEGKLDKLAYLGMCDLIRFARIGYDNEFDADLLRASVSMLHIMHLYKNGFENIFLDESRVYFDELDRTRWVALGLKDYILSCVKLLEKEGTRCDTYNLNSETKRALLNSARSILVIQRSGRLLDTDGVAKLLEDNETHTLKALYELLKASSMQEDLKQPWEEYIKKMGSRIVGDPEKGESMVVGLLELKRSLEVIIRDAFDKDDRFKWALREAYSSFINDRKNTTNWGIGQSKVGEVIAKYIDLLLRGGLKAVPQSLASDSIDRQDAEKRGQASTSDEDAELDRQLEQGIELFRFIQGKDVFEAFYKKDLARRLLMSRSASQDAERNMLTKLKSECGSNFTHNLEQMFKDQELSRDEMISYKQSLSNTSKTTVDLQVSVLSAAAWPTYPDVDVNLPLEVARHIEKFDRHYKHKHTGRKLVWKHALAHSIVKAQFSKGTKELIVSGFQAIVLVLFNDIGPDGNLSYQDLQSSTGLVDAELQRTLQSLACAKIRVLTKHPKSRGVDKTDTFTVNTTFTDPKYRIKINQIQLKETKEDIQETHERVAQDRQYETQAAIVRIMKSRKVMTHGALVAEVINQTKSRGAVELGEIKRNIEKLIEKDYIERDGSSYTYLA